MILDKWGIKMKANKAGDRIRIARAMYKLNQDDLVARLQLAGINISRNTLSRIEVGDRYVTDLELFAFAQVLNVSAAWLLEETDNPKTWSPSGKSGA